MLKVVGITLVMLGVCAVAATLNPNFLSGTNIENVVRWTGLYGVLAIGVTFVIITGGIDLSIGSVVGLIGCLLPWLLVKQEWPVVAALAACLIVSLAIGLTHGLLVTRAHLQPFVVTLCGLLIYRGVARWFTDDATQGFGSDFRTLRKLATGMIELPGVEGFRLPVAFVILLLLAVAAAVFLNQTVWGRYLLALGRNERAARYSGIDTDRMTIVAYLLCSLCAGLGGVLFALDVNSVQPSSQGQGYELFAIAAAVLGGCSLRGGEGRISGVVVGTAMIPVLNNVAGLLGVPSKVEFATIGAVILVSVIADEALQRWTAARRAARGRANTTEPSATSATSAGQLTKTSSTH